MILSGTVLFPDGVLRDGEVVVENGLIVEVREARVHSARQSIIAPGFIDLQINGAFGCDFTAQPETMSSVAQQLPRTGVTALLSTIISAPLETYQKVFIDLPPLSELYPTGEGRGGGLPPLSELYPTGEGRGGGLPPLSELYPTGEGRGGGSRILGLHLEGPYLSPQRAGAHNPAFLRARADPLADGLVNEHVRLVTLAPELENSLQAIRDLRAHGIIVSVGHSAASYEQACAAFDAGARWGTHLFNAMTPLHHREPGLIGALLADERVMIGVIADGVHVHPSIFNWLIEAKGAERVTLVSDAMAAAGLGPGEYRLGDRRVSVDEKSARLENGTLAGTLAGSVLTMDQAVRNLVAWRACSLAEALTMASTTAAQLLGLDQLGRIEAGRAADLVVLDEDLHVQQTIINGQIVA